MGWQGLCVCVRVFVSVCVCVCVCARVRACLFWRAHSRVHMLPKTVKPTITIGLSYISLDYDAKAVPGRTTVTCSAPTSVALCFLRLSRVVSYGPSTRRSVILAEVDNAEKWTNPDVAKLPNTEVSGVASQRRISYTLTKVSCLLAISVMS